MEDYFCLKTKHKSPTMIQDPLRVLIIEDDADLAANLYDYLEAKGHTPDAAHDGITGLHLAITNEYDVIIMDVMMPGMNGLAACKKLREEANKSTPVLMLTAKDTLDDKLAGFDSGADDYLIKPFALQELLARLTVLARRHGTSGNKPLLQVADLSFNPNTLEVTRAGQLITLPPIALKILQLLISKSPNVVSRQEIENALWHDAPPDSDALRAHMYSLRNAVDKPFDKPLIHTIHGIGFRLMESDQ
jgi:DNA-binding response OmpR family regulator